MTPNHVRIFHGAEPQAIIHEFENKRTEVAGAVAELLELRSYLVKPWDDVVAIERALGVNLSQNIFSVKNLVGTVISVEKGVVTLPSGTTFPALAANNTHYAIAANA